MKAIVIHRNGGPEVLQFEDAPQPEPAAGELRVRVSAAGLNFIDVYQRIGLYPQKMPFIPGSELAGVVDAVGAGVSRDRIGESVAIAHNVPVGAYAQYACIPAQRSVTVPSGVDVRVAGAVMLQGMTAHYLALTTFPLSKSITCVVHAAAGGVGLLLVQIAKMQGARVIGTVSTEEKASLARSAGADEIIFYSREEVAPSVKRLTDGRGADVVYDSVGKNTFEQSLASLRPRGMLVSFGQSSGAVPPFDVLQLSRGGSLFLTRPTLGHYVATAEELQRRSADLFRWILEGSLKRPHRRRIPSRASRRRAPRAGGPPNHGQSAADSVTLAMSGERWRVSGGGPGSAGGERCFGGGKRGRPGGLQPSIAATAN